MADISTERQSFGASRLSNTSAGVLVINVTDAAAQRQAAYGVSGATGGGHVNTMDGHTIQTG
jgi:hypothetical protein